MPVLTGISVFLIQPLKGWIKKSFNLPILAIREMAVVQLLGECVVRKFNCTDYCLVGQF